MRLARCMLQLLQTMQVGIHWHAYPTVASPSVVSKALPVRPPILPPHLGHAFRATSSICSYSLTLPLATPSTVPQC